jgi:protein-tyrosine phosphatase
MEEAARMLEIAKKDGISCIFATPHILDGLYPNKGAEIISSVMRMRELLPAGLELLYGADVRVIPDLPARLASGDILTLNGSGYLLLELPEFVVPPQLDAFIFRLKQEGITSVITHPERHLRLMHDLKGLSVLREMGGLSQITAMSITGGFGRDAEDAAFRMIEKGLADIVASDAHDAVRRPPILSKAYQTVKRHFGGETAERLFRLNPGMILERCAR